MVDIILQAPEALLKMTKTLNPGEAFAAGIVIQDAADGTALAALKALLKEAQEKVQQEATGEIRDKYLNSNFKDEATMKEYMKDEGGLQVADWKAGISVLQVKAGLKLMSTIKSTAETHADFITYIKEDKPGLTEIGDQIEGCISATILLKDALIEASSKKTITDLKTVIANMKGLTTAASNLKKIDEKSTLDNAGDFKNAGSTKSDINFSAAATGNLQNVAKEWGEIITEFEALVDA